MLDSLVDRLLGSDLKVPNYFLSIHMEIRTIDNTMRWCSTPYLKRRCVFLATVDHFSLLSPATYVTQIE